MPEQEEGNPLRQGEEEEGAHTARGQEGEGDGPRMHTARRPRPEEGGEPPLQQCAIPAHGIPKQEEGDPLS